MSDTGLSGSTVLNHSLCQVTLVVPWLVPEEQKTLYPKDKQFKDAKEQVRCTPAAQHAR